MSIITIDGPSGVGKSTVSKRVAASLQYTYLDTGAMYRAVGLYLFRNAVDIEKEESIPPYLLNLHIELLPAPSQNEDVVVLLNSENVSSAIRTNEISMIASKVSSYASVRDFLTSIQRQIGEKGNIVAEGRDMGTVVFPQAEYKFYLDASAEERCRRRVNQLRRKGEVVEEKEILKSILERDKNDSERAIAPLKKADDAFFIDSTDINIDAVCSLILERAGQGKM